ncbi:MAG TPA: hypothetical protein PL009_13235 [Flavipsychrobacter sp.]|nr:hypothetical protein [Flavipsychrobacter sp.]
MKKIFFALGIAGIIGLGFAGCYNDNSEELYPQPTGAGCDTLNVTYTKLKPLIDAQCATAGCHAGAVPSGWDLSNYNGLKAVADNGRLMLAVTHTGGASQMPKGMPKLDPCSIAKLQAWINNNKPQ